VAGVTVPPVVEKNILIVEDSASVRKLIELTLRREGHQLVFAESGIAALASLAECEPDLVLLDMMLVAIDGLQICSTMRKHPRYACTPVIMLTGRESEEDRSAGYDAGVDAYLTKPFRPDELLQAVRAALASPVRAGAA
jgi:DNA-binding response OmpR family regulator